MKSYTYLLINLLSLAIPLGFSFGPRLAFYQKFRIFLPAIILTGLFFATWDIAFTYWKIWGFNQIYLIGITWLGLPLEEWLFFLAIPYSCIFLHESLNYFFPQKKFTQFSSIITVVLVIISAGMGIQYYHKPYTLFVCLLTTLLLTWHQWYNKSSYLGGFYRSYLVTLVPFGIVNGLLTGTFLTDGIVWYDNLYNSGMRIGAIPVEDFFYALTLILLNITLLEACKKLSPLQKGPKVTY
jgi:lycopene cyclase domain-containing protein